MLKQYMYIDKFWTLGQEKCNFLQQDFVIINVLYNKSSLWNIFQYFIGISEVHKVTKKTFYHLLLIVFIWKWCSFVSLLAMTSTTFVLE